MIQPKRVDVSFVTKIVTPPKGEWTQMALIEFRKHRGNVHMTSVLRGEGGLPQKQTIVLISCVSVIVTRGEGVQKSDVIYTCPPGEGRESFLSLSISAASL